MGVVWYDTQGATYILWDLELVERGGKGAVAVVALLKAMRHRWWIE